MTDFKAPVNTGPGEISGATLKIQEALYFSEVDNCASAVIEIRLVKYISKTRNIFPLPDKLVISESEPDLPSRVSSRKITRT